MKITVCELPNNPNDLDRDWTRLVAHVKETASDLVLLPEMIFHPWVAWTDQVDPAIWQASVNAHTHWLERLAELAPASVLGSRPIIKDGKRLNEGFSWNAEHGYQAIHAKYYLPDEDLFWEATWYQRGDFEFTPFQSGQARIGFMICTELWFSEHARAYGKNGVHLIANPRATEMFSVEKWVVGGRAAAITSGAYCISSNHGGVGHHNIKWGGAGWVIEPDGEVLGRTSRQQPFVTVEIDLQAAERAKQTYPRYVRE